MNFDASQLRIQKTDGGTTEKPLRYCISSGKLSGSSLVFHIKIQDKYYELHLRKNSGSKKPNTTISVILLSFENGKEL